jgi:hypothetical protein
MSLPDFLTAIGERYGLLPVYALIVAAAGVMAGSLRQLLGMLTIMTGVYVVMFRAFDLRRDFDIFQLAERLGLNPDVADGLATAGFVFGLGLAVYALKRLFLRRRS